MTKYLISFPAEAMQLAPEDFEAAGRDSRAVIAEAKSAGVYVFAAGLDSAEEPLLVPPEGPATRGTHPGSNLSGGFTILELPDRAAAEHWAAKIARACRCAQEVRAFHFDPLT